MNDEEAKVKGRISTFKSSLGQLKSDFENDIIQFNAIKNEFNNVKLYFPSESSTVFDGLAESSTIYSSIDSIEYLLDEKSNDIEEPILDEKYQIHIDVISKHLGDSVAKVELCNNKIANLNSKKKNTNREKLDLKKRLCKARYQKLIEDLDDEIREFKSLNEQKEKIQASISEKESQVKVSKQTKVDECLQYYLSCFFGNKYSYDKDQSSLQLHKHEIKENATDVLSDGEKSIVAFCIYLSELHKQVDRDSDYEKLFFIIDDPISSLDFHYVYSVAQILRTLHENLKLKWTRFIVFTHNLEFMSVLIRNKIIKDSSAILSNGVLSSLSRELVMPYEEHLRDVYKVSVEFTPPTHTTPNSVRHVIETINKFEAPNMDLKQFIEESNLLENNELVYSLMHDGSHGALRQQVAYTPEMIISGCKRIVEFIKSKYKGQIELIAPGA